MVLSSLQNKVRATKVLARNSYVALRILNLINISGGFTSNQIEAMIARAKIVAQRWYDIGMIPPSSGTDAVFCSEWVKWMPHYEEELKLAVGKEVYGTQEVKLPSTEPLRGLKIVLNSGHGSGGFFESVLEVLGADVTASIHNQPDGSFPVGVPNPESQEMIDETVEACRNCNADIGILLDTDADRCGMVLKSTCGYEPLNRNRKFNLDWLFRSPRSEKVTNFLRSRIDCNGGHYNGKSITWVCDCYRLGYIHWTLFLSTRFGTSIGVSTLLSSAVWLFLTSAS
eukprot:scaffold2526_cov131-Cylindrotheca_fusiformis.AAC.20